MYTYLNSILEHFLDHYLNQGPRKIVFPLYCNTNGQRDGHLRVASLPKKLSTTGTAVYTYMGKRKNKLEWIIFFSLRDSYVKRKQPLLTLFYSLSIEKFARGYSNIQLSVQNTSSELCIQQLSSFEENPRIVWQFLLLAFIWLRKKTRGWRKIAGCFRFWFCWSSTDICPFHFMIFTFMNIFILVYYQ